MQVPPLVVLNVNGTKAEDSQQTQATDNQNENGQALLFMIMLQQFAFQQSSVQKAALGQSASNPLAEETKGDAKGSDGLLKELQSGSTFPSAQVQTETTQVSFLEEMGETSLNTFALIPTSRVLHQQNGGAIINSKIKVNNANQSPLVSIGKNASQADAQLTESSINVEERPIEGVVELFSKLENTVTQEVAVKNSSKGQTLQEKTVANSEVSQEGSNIPVTALDEQKIAQTLQNSLTPEITGSSKQANGIASNNQLRQKKGEKSEETVTHSTAESISTDSKLSSLQATKIPQSMTEGNESKNVALREQKNDIQPVVQNTDEQQGTNANASGKESSYTGSYAPSANSKSTSSPSHTQVSNAQTFRANEFSEILQSKSMTGTSQTNETARAIIEQIVNTLTLNVKEGMSQVKIMLQPESLGEIMVKVKMDKETIHAEIDVTNPTTKGMLEVNLPQLRDALTARGIDMQKIEIVGSYQSNPNSSEQRKDLKENKLKQSLSWEDEAPSEEERLRDLGYNTMEITL
jgi:flagellar hook-length control protein FliK